MDNDNKMFRIGDRVTQQMSWAEFPSVGTVRSDATPTSGFVMVEWDDGSVQTAARQLLNHVAPRQKPKSTPTFAVAAVTGSLFSL